LKGADSMKQDRLKSKVVWFAIVGAIMQILVTVGVLDDVDVQYINEVIFAIGSLLVYFGVLNNPTDKNNF